MVMREREVFSLGPHGLHRLAYTEWGEPANQRVVICVHGLTRTGRDFDALAGRLAADYRVACPDLPGRGRSHWLAAPGDYVPLTYLGDLVTLIARLDVEEVDWVGTSLGGLLGIMLAAQPDSPIRKLVINDIGAFVPHGCLERIVDYVGTDPHFATLEALEGYLREVHATFGPLTDAQWQHLARHSARPDTVAGGFRLHYDPKLAQPFRESAGVDLDLWPLWERITCPVLILRGSESDVLPLDIAEAMLTRGPAAELVEFPDVGHAPALMDDAQIDVIRDWLAR
jgi:pimeloyl-ACP methyl ester carboxylesterase